MEKEQKDFVSWCRFKKVKVKNEEYFKKNQINPLVLSNSQRNHVDKLIDIVKVCENHPVYSKLAYLDIVKFIQETNNLTSYGINIIFKSILNQLEAGFKARKSKEYTFKLDPNLLVYLKQHVKF